MELPVSLVFDAVLAISFLLTVGVGVAVWSRRSSTGARSLLALTVGTAVWIGADLAAGFSTTEGGTTVWLTVLWVGVVTVPTSIFVFALEYTGREHLVTRRTVAALAVVPAVTFALVLTNEFHGWIWADVVPSPDRSSATELAHGPAYWGYVGYAYGLVAVATALVGGLLYRSTTLYRGQAASLLVGIVGPWLGNLTYLVDTTDFDLTPVGFGLTAVALGFAMTRYRFGDVVPVARNTVVDNITDGVFVLDRTDRIVDVNRRGVELLADDSDSVVGRSAREVFPPAVLDRYETAGRGAAERTIEWDGEHRHLAIDVTPLEDRRGREIGRLFIVRDVTERRSYERELERQNDQLDRFAGLVSHDLRNPLAVAQGYLENVRSRTDDPDAEEVRRSLDRMERIIDDVLTLAREGQSLSEREPVDLAALAADAWNNVATADATLAIDVDHVVRADPSRLTRAFENLFRNAVEHGGSDVAVEVGSLDASATDDGTGGTGGFFVADDGPGIPEANVDAVLESGYSTASDGTGLGLDIVESIVETHGWELSIETSDAGGARFEVRYAGAPAVIDEAIEE